MEHKTFHTLPARIGGIFEKLNNARNSQLNDIKTLRERIYGLQDHQRETWGSQLTLPDLYEQCQTLKAHILDTIYSSPENLFDCTARCNCTEGTEGAQEPPHEPHNGEGDLMAIKQKAVVQDALEKMKIGNKLEKVVEELVETGECTLFVGWETRRTLHRRPTTLEERMESGKTFVYENKKVFDGAMVKTIAAQDFVFDAARASNWDGCAKIFRTHLDLEDLKSDPNNVYLTSEVLESLKTSILKSHEGVNVDGIRDGQVEVLEYWGDIELDDGTYLKNQFIVCVARQAIVRFEENPFLASPFIYANLIENPTTKRGISPLKPVLAINSVASKILNNQLDAYSLIINPPYLAPKGAFKGQQSVSPGKIVEYDSSLLPQSPTPLNFSPALCGWDFIKYFKSSIESTTGVYRTMAGNDTGSERTATELRYSANGQNARLNMIINAINRKVIVPMVEKVAQTISNFKCGEEVLTVRIGGKKTSVIVDDSVRQGEYVYKYSDRKASLERKWRARELSETIAAFAKVPGFSEKINWDECFKFSLEQLGVENVQKYTK